MVARLPRFPQRHFVASLVDQSLLRQSGARGAEPRFQMLETIRAFGLERLHQSKEFEEAQRAYASYFLDLVEGVEPKLIGAAPSHLFCQPPLSAVKIRLAS